jgi:ribosomal protein S18 acetylase RimI-like enzyme
MIELVPAREDDLAFIAALHGAELGAFRAELACIVQRGERVGFVRVRQDGGALELWEIAVLPTLRGRGIGTATLRMLQGRADAIVLATTAGGRARGLYERLGFCIDDERDGRLYMRWASANPVG